MGNRRIKYFFYSPQAAKRSSGAILAYYPPSRIYFKFTQCQDDAIPANWFADNYCVLQADDSALVYLEYADGKPSPYAKGFDLTVARRKADAYMTDIYRHNNSMRGSCGVSQDLVHSAVPIKLGSRGKQCPHLVLEALAAAKDVETVATLLCMADRLGRRF